MFHQHNITTFHPPISHIIHLDYFQKQIVKKADKKMKKAKELRRFGISSLKIIPFYGEEEFRSTQNILQVSPNNGKWLQIKFQSSF